MRKPIVAGNWKMNKTITEAVELVNLIKRGVYEVNDVEVVVAPPFLSLPDVWEVLSESNVALGAQNCHWETEGAFTGEISVSMLKNASVEYVIVGHSERRKYFAESDQVVNKKTKLGLEAGLKPIVCVGETLEERESGKTLEIVERQVKGAFAGITQEQADPIILAYEPVWAIGTGKTATPQQAQEVHAMIRGLLERMYSSSLSGSKRVLYGGSMKPSNCEELMKEPDIDGGLIGGASLQAESFIDIITKTAEIYTK